MEETDRTGLRARVPVRTCVGCRRSDSWSVLLRVVAVTAPAHGGTPTGTLVPDPRHRMPGRGAWLHPSTDCLDQALARRAFGRALRVSVTLDPGPVREHLVATSPDTASQ